MKRSAVGGQAGRGIAVLVAFALLLAACEGGGGAAPPPAPPSDPSAPEGRPLGDPPPLIDESPQVPDRSSPEAVLRSVLAGRTRQDLPYLARCGSRTAGKARLDKGDAADAFTAYSMKSIQPFWGKIEAALAAGAARFTEEGDSAIGTFDVGGSLGEIELPFVRIDGKWYLDLGE